MYASQDIRDVFMEPQCMNFMAKITENLRIT